MKIRFLRTTASAAPGYPFQAGQVITVDHLTPEMRAWLEPMPDGTVRAELIRRDDEETEVAVVGAAEQAVTRRTKRGA